MECPKCKFSYDPEIHVPLLLMGCGHTLCRICAEKIYTQNTIICTECRLTSTASSIKDFPTNMALLRIAKKIPENMILSPANTTLYEHSPRALCEVHEKELEAFCENDSQLLCIDCILLNSHKDHAIASIIESSRKIRTSFLTICESTSKSADILTGLLAKTNTMREESAKAANTKKDLIQKTYSEFYRIAQTRETQLKQEVDSALEKYHESLDEKINQITIQLLSIGSFQKEAASSKAENDYEFLKKSRERNVITASLASAVIPKVNAAAALPDIVKDKEAVTLCGLLITDQSKLLSLKSPLHTGSLKKIATITPSTASRCFISSYNT